MGLGWEIPRTLLFITQQTSWALACLCHFPLDLQDTQQQHRRPRQMPTQRMGCVTGEKLWILEILHFITSSTNLFVLEGDMTLSHRLLIAKRTLKEAQIQYQGFVFLSFSAKQAGPWKTHRVVPFPTFHLLPYHLGIWQIITWAWQFFTTLTNWQRLGPNVFNLWHIEIN